MAGDGLNLNSNLKIMSDEELEASLQTKTADPDSKAKASYHGVERRCGEDRRQGPNDRRAMVRFEPEKGRTDRRSGKDRRKNTDADDLWDKRDF